jgi:hypothetical protein
MKIGTWHYADSAYPTFVTRGKSASVELLGNLPNSQVQLSSLTGQFHPAPWPAGTNGSGPRVPISMSDVNEILEGTPASAESITSLPVAIQGRLFQPGEKDSYTLAVTPDAKLKFEVFAERFGAPIDPVLIIQDEKGAQLARGDDGPGTVDPSLDFTVPAKRDSIKLVISDLLNRGGPSCTYRIVVSSADDSATQRDFRLFTPQDQIRVPRGGSALLPIYVTRKGYGRHAAGSKKRILRAVDRFDDAGRKKRRRSARA